jgi:hypothetical protein
MAGSILTRIRKSQDRERSSIFWDQDWINLLIQFEMRRRSACNSSKSRGFAFGAPIATCLVAFAYLSVWKYKILLFKKKSFNLLTHHLQVLLLLLLFAIANRTPPLLLLSVCFHLSVLLILYPSPTPHLSEWDRERTDRETENEGDW